MACRELEEDQNDNVTKAVSVDPVLEDNWKEEDEIVAGN